jgi:hypothetical protein
LRGGKSGKQDGGQRDGAKNPGQDAAMIVHF